MHIKLSDAVTEVKDTILLRKARISQFNRVKTRNGECETEFYKS